MFTFLRMPITEVLIYVRHSLLPSRVIAELVVAYVKVGSVNRATRLLREAKALCII